jgi:tRNA-dihydrouridine synthase A
VLNGGLNSDEEMAAQLQHLDGVMIGRRAYHDPWAMAGWDARFFGDAVRTGGRDEVEAAMVAYLQRLAAAGLPWAPAARHMMGLRHGQPGARHWRRVWSDARLKSRPPDEVSRLARAAAAQHNAGIETPALELPA